MLDKKAFKMLVAWEGVAGVGQNSDERMFKCYMVLPKERQ